MKKDTGAIYTDSTPISIQSKICNVYLLLFVPSGGNLSRVDMSVFLPQFKELSQAGQLLWAGNNFPPSSPAFPKTIKVSTSDPCG